MSSRGVKSIPSAADFSTTLDTVCNGKDLMTNNPSEHKATVLRPTEAIPFHSHNCEESVMLLEGEAVLDVGREEIRLRPLDTTWIPPNVSHRFRNLSATEPMKIFWIYEFPFVPGHMLCCSMNELLHDGLPSLCGA